MAFFNTAEIRQIQALFHRLSQPETRRPERVKLWLEEQKRLNRADPLMALRRELPYLKDAQLVSDEQLLQFLTNELNRQRVLNQLSPEQKLIFSQAEPSQVEEASPPVAGQAVAGEQAATMQSNAPATNPAPAFMPQPTTSPISPRSGRVITQNEVDKAEVARVGAATAKGERIKQAQAAVRAGATIEKASQLKQAEAAMQRAAHSEAAAGIRNALKNVGSASARSFYRAIGRQLTPMRLATLASGGIGAIVGKGLAGNTGAAFGAITGAVLPSAIRNGDFARFLSQTGNRAVIAFSNLSDPGFGSRFGGGFLGGGRSSAKGLAGKRIVLVALLSFLMLALLTGFTYPGNQQATPTAGNTGLGTGNLASCKFTRAGVSKPVGSSKLQSIFQEVAAKAGVPAPLLASVSMHESPDFTANANDNHDAFFNRNFSGVECKPHFSTSPTGALGLMQIQPPTTILPNANPNAYSQDGVSNGLNFQGKSLSSLTMMDFCDVKSSVYLGTGVLVGKNGGTPPTTAEAIKKAACSYYGACDYGAGNYGDEAVADWTNCQALNPPGTNPLPAGPVGFSVSCPLGTSYKVSCGTAANPVNSCGHGGVGYASTCDPTYYVCNGTKYSEALYHALDVIPSATNKVSLPFINGTESVSWTKVDPQPVAIGGGSWGYRIDYQTNYKGHNIYLDLTHLNSGIDMSPTLKSGDAVGTVFPGIGHLHTGIQVDGRWIEPQTEVNMCK